MTLPISPADLRRHVETAVPGCLLASVTGSHLYGIASPACDVDVRGVHLLPLREVVRIDRPLETLERRDTVADRSVDLVSLDLRRFLELVLRKTGFLYESVLAPEPLVITEGGTQLRALMAAAVNRNLFFHYQGFYRNRLGEFRRSKIKRAVDLLHMYRTLLTGLHLLQSGEVEPRLPQLLQRFGVTGLDDVIAAQAAGKDTLKDERVPALVEPLEGWHAKLEAAHRDSKLPEQVPNISELDEFLVRCRTE